jgi:hypothetical protein
MLLDEFFGKEHSSSSRKALLREIYDTPKEDVEQFFEAISQNVSEELFPGAPKESSRKLISGKPDAVKGPKNLSQEVSGFVRIWSGWHDDAFVWHIEPAQIRRPWKVSDQHVMYAVAQTMNKVIPKRIKVDIWKPQRDWEIKTFTFKAQEIRLEWSIQEEDLQRLTRLLFEVLAPMV